MTTRQMYEKKFTSETDLKILDAAYNTPMRRLDTLTAVMSLAAWAHRSDPQRSPRLSHAKGRRGGRG